MQRTPISCAGARSESIAAFPHPESQTPAEALSESHGAFDPQHWLSRFERVGGGWIVRDCLSLAILVEGRSDAELIEARQMVIDLRPEDRASIVDHLRGRDVMEACHGED